jgi:hypothetical protein
LTEVASLAASSFCRLHWRWDDELKLFLWIETLSEFALIGIFVGLQEDRAARCGDQPLRESSPSIFNR